MIKKIKNIPPDKILLFTTQLNSLLKSGIPFSDSLNILTKAENNKYFKNILLSINKDINKGKSITDSFKNFRNIFGDTFICIIRVGEVSGNINSALDGISSFLESSLEKKRKLASILIYPAIVLFVAIAVLVFLVIYILPNFIILFKENNISLPSSTKFLLFLSENFTYFLLSLLLIVFFLFLTNKKIQNNFLLNLKKDKFILNLPLIGNLIQLSIAEKIYYYLYTLLKAEIDLIESLDIIYFEIKNSYIKLNLKNTKNSIMLGEKIAPSLKKIRLFNSRFQSFIDTGAESGFLAETFLEISKILKKEYEYKQKKYITFIEPLSIIFLGSLIIFMVLAIYSPIFSLSNSF